MFHGDGFLEKSPPWPPGANRITESYFVKEAVFKTTPSFSTG